MKFSYEAYSKSGALKTGSIEAGTKEEATDQLRKKGLFVTSIHEGGAGGAAIAGSGPKKKRRSSKVSVRLVAEFARELSVLIATGTPLIDSISSIERQSGNEAWSQILKDVRLRLEEGDSLTVSLESHTEIFDPVFRSLVAAGESSGHLDSMLQRVAVLTRKQAQIRSSLVGAMVYPFLLIGIPMT